MDLLSAIEPAHFYQKQTFPRSCFQIMKNSKHCFEVFLIRRMHKLTYHTYNKAVSVGYEINKSTSQVIFDICWYPQELPPFTSPSFTFAFIGVSVGLQPLIPVSFKRSRVYFLCDTTIPLFDLAISIPKKYLNCPKSLNSNSLSKHCFNRLVYSVSSPVKIISST